MYVLFTTSIISTFIFWSLRRERSGQTISPSGLTTFTSELETVPE